MHRNKLTISSVFILILMPLISFSQQLYKVELNVVDKSSGVGIPYATCQLLSNQKGFVANESGYISFVTTKGQNSIKASSVGYNAAVLDFELVSDTALTLYLESIEIGEVKVYSDRKLTLLKAQSGKITVPLYAIESVPKFLGEPDLLKSLMIYPGITSTMDGYSSLLIRGGNSDQNLFLIDDCPVFNINHLGGFVSLFNTNSIKYVDVYKNSFPSQYGGKISGVIDIKTRDGNMYEYHGEVSLGIVSSGFLIEGPIIKNRMTFLTSFRTSYFDLINKSLREDYEKSGNGSYFNYKFYDMNTRLSYYLSKNSRVYLSFYNGKDNMENFDASVNLYTSTGINEKTTDISSNTQNNTLVSLGYRNNSGVISTSVNGYLSLYSQLNKEYHEQIIVPENNINDSEMKIGLYKYGFKIISDYSFRSNDKILVSFESGWYSVVPGEFHRFTFSSIDSITNIFSTGKYNSGHPFEVAGSIENQNKLLNGSMELKFGVRLNQFNNDLGKVFFDIEPRISATYFINELSHLGLSYTQMNQYIHGLVNNLGGFERIHWFASGNELLPQCSQQYSLSYNAIIKKYDADIIAEFFYKKSHNLPLIKTVQSALDYQNFWVNRFDPSGVGYSYGFELLLTKQTPRFLGIISYTYQKSFRRFETLNEGKWFPYDFDRPHNLNIQLQLNSKKNIVYSATFVLRSGTPINLPSGIATSNLFFSYSTYNGYNNYRLPVYHRLDLSVKRNWNTSKGNTFSFFISIFNAYARVNPTAVEINNNKLKGISYFTIIPSAGISYKF